MAFLSGTSCMCLLSLPLLVLCRKWKSKQRVPKQFEFSKGKLMFATVSERWGNSTKVDT